MVYYRWERKLVPLSGDENHVKAQSYDCLRRRTRDIVSSLVITTDFSAILDHGVLGAKALWNGAAAAWIPRGILSFRHVNHSLIQIESQK